MKLGNNARLTRWALFLQGYNFKIHYRKGSLNNVADTLSRIHDQKSLTEQTKTGTTDDDGLQQSSTDALIHALQKTRTVGTQTADRLAPVTAAQLTDNAQLADATEAALMHVLEDSAEPNADNQLQTITIQFDDGFQSIAINAILPPQQKHRLPTIWKIYAEINLMAKILRQCIIFF